MVVLPPDSLQVSDDMEEFVVRDLSSRGPESGGFPPGIAADRVNPLECEPFFHFFDDLVDVRLSEKPLATFPTFFVHVWLAVATEGKVPVFLDSEQNLTGEERTGRG